MTNSIVLVSSVNDLKILKDMKLSSETKVFSLNVHAHKLLDKKGIPHEIAENYLSHDDRLKLFDKTVSLYDWYKKKSITNDVCLEDVNIFGILDTAELHIFLIKTLYNFLIVKRIIEKEAPKQIITNTNISKLVESLINRKEIDLKVHSENLEQHLAWDTIEIKFNLGKIPISFHISRSRYNKIKDLLESTLGTILNLWFYPNAEKKTILLLEFNPSAYKDLLQNLGKYDRNIILLNRRRSAIWNIESIKILNRTKCKIIDFKKILSQEEKNQVDTLIKDYNQKLDKIWVDNSLLDIFSIEGYSFWLCIKDVFVETYGQRLSEYIDFIMSVRKILKKTNVTCIVSLNLVGETEKIILDLNKNQIPSIMLEHGYANYTKEIARYDILSMYPLLRDKIAVWGEVEKQYLVSQHNLAQNRILITGSPKHDSFFKRKTSNQLKQSKVILLTIHPITEISGQTDTNLYVKFENLIRNFCKSVKKLDNVHIIVKLHPGQDTHNNDIKTLFNEIDPTIPVYQLKPIIELLEKCDALINISPEGFDPSTVILESLIMNKPTMNIILDEKFFEFQYVKDKAVISISDKSDLEKNLSEILFNNDIRKDLMENGKKHLQNYLSNHGSASESLAKILASY